MSIEQLINISKGSLPVSKEMFQHHINTFVCYLQSDVQHQSFSAGHKWWALTYSKNVERNVPNAVTFTEQIGITDQDLHYGP